MPYRLRTKQLFLTYPQCYASKQEFYDDFVLRFDPIELVVAHELHQNGDSHLHCYLKLATEVDTRDCNYFDTLGYHGNYQGCRSSKNVMKYCTKAEDYVSNINVAEILDARKYHRKVFAQELVSGVKRPLDVLRAEPSFVYTYKQLKTSWQQMKLDEFEPRMKQVKAYWYYGETRLGKSWKALIDMGVDVHGVMSQVYFKPVNKWFDGYNGQDIVMMDEVELSDGCWLLGKLKKWTDALPELVEVKSGFCPKEWSIFIVTSNHSIRDVFYNGKNQLDVDALYERFSEVFIHTKQY